MSQLCRDLDKRSKEILRDLLDIAYAFFILDRTLINRPQINIRDEALWRTERSQISATFNYSDFSFAPEIWFQHHGMRFASECVKNYVRDRDIIDAGASDGDSLVILDRYTDRRIFSYELIPATADTARRVASNLRPEKHFVFNLGLSNISYTTSVSSHGHSASGLYSHGDALVNVTTIDEEAKRLNFTVGFIKADVEGFEPEVILGAINTIKRDRPVISMSLYHNEELLFLPRLLSLLGYQLKFYYGNFLHLHYETNVMGIPPEVENVCRFRVKVPPGKMPYSIDGRI
jgi:FkbM family methyltransferase